MMYRAPVCVAATSLYFNKKKVSKESLIVVILYKVNFSLCFIMRKKAFFIHKKKHLLTGAKASFAFVDPEKIISK